MDFCQGRSSLAICDFEDFPFVKDFLCENCAVTAQWTNFKPLSSATPGEMQDGKYEKLAQWLSASARLNNLSYLALYSNKGETLVSLCYAFQHCAQICQIWPNMPNMHIWVHIWARAIWSSGVSLKRSCKMQFRRVGLRSIGPSSQKLWPNQSFGRSPHCKCKTSKWWPEWIYGSIMLNIFVCHFLTKLHPLFTWEEGK